MVRANEQTDKRVAQYFRLGFWLIWPTVQYVVPQIVLLIFETDFPSGFIFLHVVYFHQADDA